VSLLPFSQEEFIHTNGQIVGGQYFQTLIQTEALTNKETRYVTYHIPLFRGQISDLIVNYHQMQYLKSFFNRRKGTQQGFRWRNPIDYKVTSEKIGWLHENPDTWTMGGVMEPPGTVAQYVTPAKIYASNGYITKKPLFLICGPTVKIYESGVYVSDAPLTANGRILYNGTPDNLSISAEFDTPTWFTSNEWPSALQAIDNDGQGQYKISQIGLEERLTRQENEL
jgi:hypothetical protein